MFLNYIHTYVCGNTHCMAPISPLCLYKPLPLYSLNCVAVGFVVVNLLKNWTVYFSDSTLACIQKGIDSSETINCNHCFLFVVFVCLWCVHSYRTVTQCLLFACLSLSRQPVSQCVVTYTHPPRSPSSTLLYVSSHTDILSLLPPIPTPSHVPTQF